MKSYFHTFLQTVLNNIDYTSSPLSGSGPMAQYTPLRSPLGDLFESGGYQAIQSPIVRRALNVYQQRLDDVDEAQSSYRNFNDLYWQGFVVENAYLFTLENRHLIENGIELPEVALNQNLEHLFANQVFSNIIFIELAESLIVKGELVDLEEATIGLLKAIESVYEIRPESI